MGVFAQKTVNDHLVYYDAAYPWRWLDAFGPDVVKFLENGVATPYAAANSLGHMTTTLVNASTIANVAGATGGALLITTAAAEHDGLNLNAVGESFYFASAWPCYFGTKLQISNVTESDLWVGMGMTDSVWHGASIPNSGIYFEKVDAAVGITDFVVRKGGVASAVAGVHTFVAATDVTLEWYFDGVNVYAYVNGTLATTVAVSNTSFPNVEYLTPTLEFKTGSGNARTCQVDWIRAIQIQTV